MEKSLFGKGWDVELGNRTVHLSDDPESPSYVTRDDVKLLELHTLAGEEVGLFIEQMVKYDDTGAKKYSDFNGPYTSVKLTKYHVYILRCKPRMYPPSTSVLSFKIVLKKTTVTE